MIAELSQRNKELVQKIQQMYDDSIILSDGRHVMPDKYGDFIVVTRNPDDNSEVKLVGADKREAQRIYDCMQARNISTGIEARQAGCR
jgi:hypothetical protein